MTVTIISSLLKIDGARLETHFTPHVLHSLFQMNILSIIIAR